MNIELDLPAGYMDILQELTVHVLRDKPIDVWQYLADYFNRLNETKGCVSSSKSKKGLGGNVTSGIRSRDVTPATTSSDLQPMIEESESETQLALAGQKRS